MTAIGLPLHRREDARFLTGQGRYLDDMAFAGALLARFVRSPHARALIGGIDTAAALAVPGVVMVAMGLSGALREHVVYDDDGHNVTGSLMDYGIAVAGDLPPIEIVSCHTPNSRTPTGSKGMSEGGAMGAVGAVTLAVNDALAPFGVVAERQPLTSEAMLGLLG